jgi:hypothetical protein
MTLRLLLVPIGGVQKKLPQFRRGDGKDDGVPYGLDHADRQIDCGGAEHAVGCTDLFGGRLPQFDLD